MSASLALQKAIRARLVGSTAVTALVPSSSILDRNSRPAPDPSVILGEDQEIDEGRIDRNAVRIYSTLHVWKKELGLTGVKAIAGAIKTAVNGDDFGNVDGFHITGCHLSGSRFMRDPDGETAHGVITIEALMTEVTS
jgi:hypothetical protein